MEAYNIILRIRGNWIDKLYMNLIYFNSTQVEEMIDLVFALYDFEEAFQRIFVPCFTGSDRSGVGGWLARSL